MVWKSRVSEKKYDSVEAEKEIESCELGFSKEKVMNNGTNQNLVFCKL